MNNALIWACIVGLIVLGGMGISMRCDEAARDRALMVGEASMGCVGRGNVSRKFEWLGCDGYVYRVMCDRSWTEVCCEGRICGLTAGAYRVER